MKNLPRFWILTAIILGMLVPGSPVWASRLVVVPSDHRAGLRQMGIPVLRELGDVIVLPLSESSAEALAGWGWEIETIDTAYTPGAYFLVARVGPGAARAPGQILWASRRFFLVRLDETEAQAAKAAGYEMVRLYEYPHRLSALEPMSSPTAMAFDSSVSRLIQAVSLDSLRRTLYDLQNFGTRYTYSRKCDSAAYYLSRRFQDLGLTVEYDTYYLPSGPGRDTCLNIVATLPSQVCPESIVVACGHYDSYSEQPLVSAPGADDNATGAAAVLEIARLFATARFRWTVKFIAFSGEEQWMKGSYHWVDSVAVPCSLKIAGVYNLDMMGYTAYDTTRMYVNTNTPSRPLAVLAESVNAQYQIGLRLVNYLDPDCAGDNTPFWDQGFPAVFVCEDTEYGIWNGSNPYYHTTRDTVGNLRPGQVKRATQLAAGCLATLAGPIANTHDVGVVKLISPTVTVDSGASVTPACSVYNYGNQTETFYARMKIGAAYNNSAQVSGLAPLTRVYVTFSNWTAPSRGSLAVSCSTELAGDVAPANDEQGGVVNVAVHDIGAVAIVAPTGAVPPGTVTPEAKVHNYGTAREACSVTFVITGLSSYISAVSLPSGLPLTGDTVIVFPSWSATTGSYTAKCSTYLASDQIPPNNVVSAPFVVAIAETGWVRKADLPLGPKSKKVNNGGCLACSDSSDLSDASYIYALKGNNRYEFYRYSTASNTWTTKESIPAIGTTGKKKAIKKGAAMTTAADKLYAAKGNNCLEFWLYNPSYRSYSSYPWTQKADVPTGAKNVKEGAGMVSVIANETTYVYLLKGSGTQEFYRYNPMPNLWETRDNAPLGASNKTWKNGSCLAYDGANTIYALKGSYNEFFSYSCSTNTWTSLATLPLIGTGGKKKKVKDGAGLAYHAGHLYAQKGGNTYEFWTYAADSDRWAQYPDVPLGTGKKVKGGGALVYASGPNALYEFKGNNTLDFFKYGLSTYTLPLAGSSQGGVMTSSLDASHSVLRIAPNPFSNATTISYSLPKPGDVSLKLYDVTGKLVNTLASGYHNAGTSWFIVSRSSLSSGIYMLKLVTGNSSTTEKVVIE